jgi:hypothetical protein
MNQSFETSQKPITPTIVDTTSKITENSGLFRGKNLLIIILSGLLILSFLGINLLASMGNLVEIISNLFGPFFVQILSIFGYTAGTVLDKSTDVVTDVAKTGIDLAGDTLQSAADLLKDASRDNVNEKALNQMDSVSSGNINSNDSTNNSVNNSVNNSSIDKTINESKPKINIPKPDNSVDPIQKPITSGKTNWCLVGEYQGKRGCIQVNDNSKCMSGQVFPSQQMCINPTRTIISHTHVQ